MCRVNSGASQRWGGGAVIKKRGGDSVGIGLIASEVKAFITFDAHVAESIHIKVNFLLKQPTARVM